MDRDREKGRRNGLSSGDRRNAIAVGCNSVTVLAGLFNKGLVKAVPEHRHVPHPFGILIGEIVQFRPVRFHIVQFPLPTMHGDEFPSALSQGPVSDMPEKEHIPVDITVIADGSGEAYTGKGWSIRTLPFGISCLSRPVEQGRQNVYEMTGRMAQLAASADTERPMHDQWRGDPALMHP